MKYGIILTHGTAREQVELARLAEARGWDGVFTWDAINIPGTDTLDPWALLGAFAVVTQTVRLGAIITPLSRRRPWKVAREALTIDHLSNGRLTLAVGLGALDDMGFGGVGEATDRRTRAERLDESLAILRGLWSGEPFAYHGRHYELESMAFQPRPVQSRIPIWVVGAWPSDRSMGRTLAHDGLLPNDLRVGPGELKPETLAEIRDWVAARRSLDAFDFIAEGTTPAHGGADIVAHWREAGATWWLEADWTGGDLASLRARIEGGPPTP